MSHKYIFVYQTICDVNGKSYIGVHATNNLNDGYIGNGIYSKARAIKKNPFHNAVRKYGYKNFRRYILSFYDTYEEAMDEEAFMVNEKWIKSSDNYNVKEGGKNSNPFASYTKEERSKIFSGEKNHRYGKMALNAKPVLQYKLNGEFIKKFNSAKEAGESIGYNRSNVSCCCVGKYGQCGGFIFRYEKYSEFERLNLNNNLLKRKRIYNDDGSWKMNEEYKAKHSIIPRRKGHKLSKEHIEKLSLAKLGKKTSPHTEETKTKIGLANKLVSLKKKQIEC